MQLLCSHLCAGLGGRRQRQVRGGDELGTQTYTEATPVREGGRSYTFTITVRPGFCQRAPMSNSPVSIRGQADGLECRGAGSQTVAKSGCPVSVRKMVQRPLRNHTGVSSVFSALSAVTLPLPRLALSAEMEGQAKRRSSRKERGPFQIQVATEGLGVGPELRQPRPVGAATAKRGGGQVAGGRCAQAQVWRQREGPVCLDSGREPGVGRMKGDGGGNLSGSPRSSRRCHGLCGDSSESGNWGEKVEGTCPLKAQARTHGGDAGDERWCVCKPCQTPCGVWEQRRPHMCG